MVFNERLFIPLHNEDNSCHCSPQGEPGPVLEMSFNSIALVVSEDSIVMGVDMLLNQ